MTPDKKITTENPGYTPAQIKVIMGALMLVLLLAALDQTIVSTALPRIATELHGLDHLIMEAFTRSFHDMFLLAIPVALLAFVAALFLRETPLKHGHEDANTDIPPSD